MLNPRTAFRLSRTALHLLQGCITVAVLYRWLSESQRHALKQRWSQQLLGILGVHLRFDAEGKTELPHGLLVANHISFLDIFVLNAIAPAAFVSKHEVKYWPVIGWLCTHTDTLFLERGSRSAAQRAREDLARHLQQGKRVAIFPEGTTTRGETVLPFRSALLQAAVDTETPVTPVALRYRRSCGRPSTAPAYVDDVSLIGCLKAIADQEKLYAEVTALPTLYAKASDRRGLSLTAQQRIAQALESETTSPIPHPTA